MGIYSMDSKERAYQAKLLRDNPFYQEIIAALNSGLVERAKNTNLRDERDNLATLIAFQVVDQIETFIQMSIDDEELKEFELKKKAFF